VDFEKADLLRRKQDKNGKSRINRSKSAKYIIIQAFFIRQTIVKMIK
jgi:hypothetical protein